MFETSRASANNSDVPSTGKIQLMFHSIFLTTFEIIECLIVLFSLLSEEPDDFYDFTAEDYFRLMSTKKEGNT